MLRIMTRGNLGRQRSPTIPRSRSCDQGTCITNTKTQPRPKKFLVAFGFIEVKREGKRIYYKGYGSEPFLYCLEESSVNEFGGAALVVESLEDLEKARAIFPNATEIYDLNEAPDGGRCVTVKDPIDGWPLHLVYGQTPVEPTKDYRYLDFNFVSRLPLSKPTKADFLLLKPHKKNRAGNEFQRFEKGPALIHKLGHFELFVTQFQKTFDFYTKNFNFMPSDIQHDKTGRHIASFLHLDLGETFYSQIFDYWYDPHPASSLNTMSMGTK
ncbi:hypothetical protein CEP52_012537 [Fusarium oligoseptatum]|uniref:Glyoxalase/fosfomycin resistance/dioxygenase domain-containing protein n=1 Tax=Fusarium oligoseptatum TaxID=2604345 RepID=A0A428SXS9_9HYPO|nr:hypothetical protein CEP52_012537 [Fusarium oligoseptatum]